jgi:hypothetical protein
MRISLVVGLVAPCFVAAACGSSGPSSGSLSGESPQEILRLTTTAITADNFSFHFIDQSRVGSKTTTLVGDDTAAGSDQVLSGTGAALAVERRSDGTIFIRGAASALESALSLSPTAAAAHAGVWISLQPSDAPYTTVLTALGPQQEINTFVPTSPYTLSSPRQFHGRTVVGVSGAARSSAVNGAGHIVTLYVPTEPPYTPVGATLTFGSGSSAGVEAVVFDRWGRRINPPAPSPALAYSSLAG